MKKALKTILHKDYPSLEAFKRKLEDNEIYVKYFDGHRLETKQANYTMVDGKVLKELKEVGE